MRRYLQTKTNSGNYDLFDAFNDFFRPVFYDEQSSLRTNIKESETDYELDVELPGYTKEQIKISLESGYLTISAEKSEKEEDKDKHYIRKEITESCSRSYYVGEYVTDDQIKAKYENGVLSLIVPKSQPKKAEGKYIAIE
ncbi:MAG: Hsp20/alpha crystallin family protein [Candidatus Coproplasma sp.]